jgi:hypothetical protein
MFHAVQSKHSAAICFGPRRVAEHASRELAWVEQVDYVTCFRVKPLSYAEAMTTVSHSVSPSISTLSCVIESATGTENTYALNLVVSSLARLNELELNHSQLRLYFLFLW